MRIPSNYLGLRRARGVVATLAILGTLLTASPGADTMYFKCDHLTGESTGKESTSPQAAWIELNSVTQTVTRAAGQEHAGDIVIEKKVDAASAALFEAARKGTVIPSMTIKGTRVVVDRYGRETNEVQFLWKLTDVKITSYSMHGATTESEPIDSFSINFAKIEIP